MNNDDATTSHQVAIACYDRARRFAPGSVHAEASEHAVSLSLNRGSGDGDFDDLLDDVLRNGYHSVRRARARRNRALGECTYLASQGVATGGTRQFTAIDSAADRCAASELLDSLTEEANSIGSHAPGVLAGLIVGDSTRQIAADTGVSTSTVDRTIKRFRVRATADGYGPDAA